MSAEQFLGTAGVDRRPVDGPESERASRAWWDADALDYLAEHGGDIGEVDFVWGPEGLREADAGLLGEVAGADVLEVGCGSAPCSRWLATVGARPVALDLSGGMLAQAAALNRRTGIGVPLVQAGAEHLPFADASFDVVVCQFGVMFFPDKSKAFAEARRVLRPGGAFLFNAWDSIEHNGFVQAVTDALDRLFPADPPRFMHRGPHGYHDTSAIAQDLARGGFRARPEIMTIAKASRADTPLSPAVGYCQGTPLRGEIEARGGGMLGPATEAAAAAIAQRFGPGPVEGGIQAHVVVAER